MRIQKTRDEVLNVYDPQVVARLHRLRLRVVHDSRSAPECVPKAPINQAIRGRDRRTVPVPTPGLIYLPEHPADWESHPQHFRAVDVCVLTAGSGPLGSAWVRYGKLFFLVEGKYGKKLLTGERSEDHLLDFLYEGLDE